MNRETIFQAWAPAAGTWTRWAKPVLFGQMPPDSRRWRTLDVAWAPPPGEHALLVVDLPGDESVWMGLALAGRGYRPVPVYNACTGANEIVDQKSIMYALSIGAEYLASLALADAPPAFLLDARRSIAARAVRPGDFDNRWMVFPEDMPSAEYLKAHGFQKAILVHHAQNNLQYDLARILRAWQAAGISIETKDPVETGSPRPITLVASGWFRNKWESLTMAVRRFKKQSGGFGHLVRGSHHG